MFNCVLCELSVHLDWLIADRTLLVHAVRNLHNGHVMAAHVLTACICDVLFMVF